jgi:hypothetical protein
MTLKKILRISLYLLALTALFTGLYSFCQRQTHGFRPYLIMSNLPNELRWEVPPLTAEEQKDINKLLDQPFIFLGSGGWCFAFLGQDQKTVLKFYKHSHLLPSSIFKEFSFKKLLLQSDPWPQNIPYFQEFNFKSCLLLYNQAKERSGILYVHLNKTQGKHKPVTLIDNIGIHHTIDLDKTEFVVQKRADLLFSHIQRLSKQKKMDEAKGCIDDFLNCLLTLCKKGIRDYDRSLRNNFGFTDDGAVTLDLSSFGPDETIKNPGQYKKEIINKTQRLSRFLRKYHPGLYSHSEQRLSEIMENGCLLSDPSMN